MLRILAGFASFASQDFSAVLARLRRNAVLYALALLFALVGFAALVVAGGIYVARTYDPLAAALIVAATMIGLALLIVICVAILSATEKRRRREAPNTSAIATTAMLTAAPYLLRSRAGMGLAAVGALAFLLTRGGSHHPGDRDV